MSTNGVDPLPSGEASRGHDCVHKTTVRFPQRLVDGGATGLGTEVGPQHVRHPMHLAGTADKHALPGAVGYGRFSRDGSECFERVPSSQAERATRRTAAAPRIRWSVGCQT